MTQKEAIIEALRQLGGRAKLTDIYRMAQLYADFSKGQTPKNSIRSCLIRETSTFRKYKPGWWELVSYQEEIAWRDQRIKELEEEVERMRAVKTEDDFVARFVKKVRHNLKRDKKVVEEIRKLMDALGRSDADKELDEWLQSKDRKTIVKIDKAGDVITAGGKKIVNNQQGNKDND